MTSKKQIENNDNPNLLSDLTTAGVVVNERDAEITVDPHDDAAVRALARQQLVKMLSAATSPAGIKVAAIKELLDRIDGKPAQNMNIRAAVAHKSEVTIRFIQPEDVE